MNLQKKLGPRALLATIFFCVSGGPFGLEPLLSNGAGVALLLIVVTPFLWSVPAALMTAELATAIPEDGGYYHWTKRAFGPLGGVLCAWWSWLYSWVDIAIYPTLFASYVHALLTQLGWSDAPGDDPLSKWGIGLGIIVPLTWLNIAGVKLVGRAAIAFGILLLLPFLVLCLLGLPHLVAHPPHGFSAPGQPFASSIGAGMSVVLWNYLGWDSMSTVAGEVEDPQRSFPWALLWAVPIIIISYLFPAAVGLSVIPDLSRWKEGAWTEMAGIIGGPLGTGVMSLAGAIGAAGLFSACLLASSRVPMVLAEEGYLPRQISNIHPRTGTPVAAILISAAFYTVLSFKSFKQLAALDVFFYSAGLLLELAALAWLRVKLPNMPRPYKIPGGWTMIVLVILFPALLVGFALWSQFVDPEEGGPVNLLLSTFGLASGFVVYGVAVIGRRLNRKP